MVTKKKRKVKKKNLYKRKENKNAPKKESTKPISGRGIEAVIYKHLTTSHPLWFVHRYNENRWRSTPADIEVGTTTRHILLEVKATKTETIQKGNIRSSQVDELQKFDNLRRTNLAFVLLYYGRYKKYVLIRIHKLDQLKSRITYKDAVEHGHIINRWVNIGRLFESPRRNKV